MRQIAFRIIALCLAAGLTSCASPGERRHMADKTAYDIIARKQQEALGRTEPMEVEPPSETLRRRLLLDQNLPHASAASRGVKDLDPIPHWPNDDYLDAATGTLDAAWYQPGETLQLSLIEALQVATRNSRTYQSRKEDVFRSALQLDLERDEFRGTFTGLLEGLFSTDHSGDDAVTGLEGGAGVGLRRRFRSGAELTSAIALDLVRLLHPGNDSSLGIAADVSISVPLLRGAGRHIVTEPLTQAERNVIYAIYEFERFKREFAVQVASQYLSVLQELDSRDNAAENYRGLIASARRARRLADAGQLPEIQVDQAMQDELRARNRWISARESCDRRLDAFKSTLGLPTDARLDLDREELSRLAERGAAFIEAITAQLVTDLDRVPPADEPIVLTPPSGEVAGPYEYEEAQALALALENRLDLRAAEGRVYDAQRRVVVAADALRGELTLFGSASAGERRGLGSAGQPNAQLDPSRGRASALLTLDLPLKRTREQAAYRNSLIDLERAARSLQELEDAIKLDVRNRLRDLSEYRETLLIQAQSVTLAQRRVDSTNLFLQAGRAQIRDLLEAQEALLSAQNALTAALVNYRIAELELQRDLDVLAVNAEGLWMEYAPKDENDES